MDKKSLKNSLKIEMISELITLLIASFLIVAILMWLWNGLAVALFSLPVITYWQAWGIYILSNILFKNSSKRIRND